MGGGGGAVEAAAASRDDRGGFQPRRSSQTCTVTGCPLKTRDVVSDDPASRTLIVRLAGGIMRDPGASASDKRRGPSRHTVTMRIDMP